MATENIIAALAAKGVSRQEAHEQIKVLSHEAARNVKEEGRENDLIDRIRANPFFEPIRSDLTNLLDPITFVGRAPQQVERFVQLEVEPALKEYRKHITDAKSAELSL